jgi:hypothetical protein
MASSRKQVRHSNYSFTKLLDSVSLQSSLLLLVGSPEFLRAVLQIMCLLGNVPLKENAY